MTLYARDLEANRKSRNRLVLLALLAFVVAVFATSFMHIQREVNGASPQQAVSAN